VEGGTIASVVSEGFEGGVGGDFGEQARHIGRSGVRNIQLAQGLSIGEQEFWVRIMKRWFKGMVGVLGLTEGDL
jgi:hypothetical protein